MAAEIITGEATIHGIQNSGSAITITSNDGYSGIASFVLDSLSGDHQFETNFLKDENGFDTSGKAWNEHIEITIDFTPVGATRTAAKAVVALPKPLTRITLANCSTAGKFASTPAVSLFNGDYLYVGGASIKQSKDGDVTITGMKVRKYADATQNASMTTIVSG